MEKPSFTASLMFLPITLSLIMLSLIMLSLILLPPLASADNLYQQDSLEMNLKVSSKFKPIATADNAQLEEASVDLFLYPAEDYRQQLLAWESTGSVMDDKVNFFWNDHKIETKSFGFTSLIRTSNFRNEVLKKRAFPLSKEDIKGYEQYTKPTLTIDSGSPAIITRASELAEGEDDLFKVAFNLASWTEENINYDLNTLTATAAQKASWVLQNKEGVCDEMTSLFIAMARSLGIPARFVSGVSYSTSELFAENWQPHGWAEVYFPQVGWVSFDIAFNQYGYVDVTHIKLRDGFDPAEPAVKYEWLADNINIVEEPLNMQVEVKKEGNFIPEEIVLEQEILAKGTDLGGYNLIKGIVKNNAGYYTATALNLVVPKEVEIIGRNRRNILLHPKEVRETYWIVKTFPYLDESYTYTFPILIYSEKNITVSDTFTAQKGNKFYSRADIEELIVKDEEKSYSRKISFDCDYPAEIKIGQRGTAKCTVKNIGNTNLQNVNFCLGNVCEIINLPINQEKSAQITLLEEKAGWKKITVSAENELIEKKMSLQFLAYDQPQMAVEVISGQTAQFGKPFDFQLVLEKKSFAEPQNVTLIVSGAGLESKWEIEKLKGTEKIAFRIDGSKLGSKNKFKITASWKDKEGQSYSQEQEISVKGTASTLPQKIKMWLRGIVNLFL
ncbi:MAG: transglutaminase domain-containing protein [Nanoarchaeota archaeon]